MMVCQHQPERWTVMDRTFSRSTLWLMSIYMWNKWLIRKRTITQIMLISFLSFWCIHPNPCAVIGQWRWEGIWGLNFPLAFVLDTAVTLTMNNGVKHNKCLPIQSQQFIANWITDIFYGNRNDSGSAERPTHRSVMNINTWNKSRPRVCLQKKHLLNSHFFDLPVFKPFMNGVHYGEQVFIKHLDWCSVSHQ